MAEALSFPLDGTTTARFMAARPQITRPRKRFTYYPGGSAVPPEVYNRAHAIEADGPPFTFTGTIHEVVSTSRAS